METIAQINLVEQKEVFFRIAGEDFSQLLELLFRRHPVEEWGTFFHFGYRITDDLITVCFTKSLEPRGSDLDVNNPYVAFSPEYISQSLDSLESTSLGLGVIHSHPLGDIYDSSVSPSLSDDDMDIYFGENLLSDYTSGSPYISLIVNKDSEGGFIFSGRLYFDGAWMPVTDFKVSGESIKHYKNNLLEDIKGCSNHGSDFLYRALL